MTTPAERYEAAQRRAQRPALTEFVEELDFALDPFQAEACDALELSLIQSPSPRD